MRLIRLTQGHFSMVPDDNFDELNKHKWMARWSKKSQTFYAVRHVPGSRQKFFLMLRVILSAPYGIEVDHRDGNGLNNDLDNIRLATKSRNMSNRGPTKKNTSGFKGVYWCKNVKKWRVKIGSEGKLIHLGLYSEILDAAKAANDAALRYHGEFAHLNLIP